MSPEDASERTNIVLAGFMGTGKSTVGALIAARLGRPHVDVDDVIVARHGPIADIFAGEGESAFRALERATVAEVSRLGGAVISTGGGAVLDPDNVAALESTGHIVVLVASAEAITARVTADVDGPIRPLLTGPDPTAAIAELLASRDAAYRRFDQLDTTGLDPGAAADLVIDRLVTSPRPR